MLVFILGFIFISLFGTLLHFTYDISKHNKIVALFSAVNESVWEHIKLALTPAFLWSLVDGYIYGKTPNYFFAKFIGIITIILIIPIIFYGYKAILKRTILIIDIASFFITVFLSQYFTYLVINMKNISYQVSYISLILLFIIFGMYLILTLLPIEAFLFKDPLTNKYGIKGHK